MDDPAKETMEALLAQVRQRFYMAEGDALFHRDRKALIYALSWPAGWMRERQLRPTQRRYRELVERSLADIALHGDPERWGKYFPRYLLKCLQDRFRHRYDELYFELKSASNALDLLALRGKAQARASQGAIDALARVHEIVAPKRRRGKSNTQSDPSQMELF